MKQKTIVIIDTNYLFNGVSIFFFDVVLSFLNSGGLLRCVRTLGLAVQIENTRNHFELLYVYSVQGDYVAISACCRKF